MIHAAWLWLREKATACLLQGCSGHWVCGSVAQRRGPPLTLGHGIAGYRTGAGGGGASVPGRVGGPGENDGKTAHLQVKQGLWEAGVSHRVSLKTPEPMAS